MERQNGDALSIRGLSQNRNKNNSLSGKSKSRGRSKSPGKNVNVCYKCAQEEHFKNDYRSKDPKEGKGSDDAPCTNKETTLDEGGDVYLASSSSAHVDHGHG